MFVPVPDPEISVTSSRTPVPWMWVSGLQGLGWDNEITTVFRFTIVLFPRRICRRSPGSIFRTGADLSHDHSQAYLNDRTESWNISRAQGSVSEILRSTTNIDTCLASAAIGRELFTPSYYSQPMFAVLLRERSSQIVVSSRLARTHRWKRRYLWMVSLRCGGHGSVFKLPKPK